MTDTMWHGITKREFLSVQMYEATRDTDVADGVLTADEDRVAELWQEYVGDRCPFCGGTKEMRTARGLYESPADALVACPWCEAPLREEPVVEAPF